MSQEPQDELELSGLDRDRLEHLVSRRLPHLLDDRPRLEFYVAECRSYWLGRGGKQPKDWPLTILNRMLREEQRRLGTLPDPARVRHEQAERRLAAAAARNAEASVPGPRDRGALGRLIKLREME